MLKTFKYRIHPGPGQRRKLEAALESCRWLHNHLLGTRKDTYEGTGYSLGYYDQNRTLPQLRALFPHLKDVHSQVLQDVAMRLDLSFKAFFRRIKAKETPGYPRFRGKGRYNSLTYTQIGSAACIKGNKIQLSKIGLIKANIHRPLEGKPKTCTVSKSYTGKWYATFSCEWTPTSLPPLSNSVGIDLGLITFATLSTGEKIESPKFFRQEEKALARVQRKMSKTTKGSVERKSRRKVVARVHERIGWRRDNFIHQTSRSVVNRFGSIFVEDLSVNQMAHNHCLAKSIYDAAWTGFTTLTSIKAEWAGRKFQAVNPAYTSQDCNKCGHRQKMEFKDRVYHCPCCGLVMCRDVNASLNILRLGQQSQGAS